MPITLTVEPGPASVRIVLSGGSCVRLDRLDRNGRVSTVPDSTDLRDLACALSGPVEYRVFWADGSSESASVIMSPTDGRPRLVTLRALVTRQRSLAGGGYSQNTFGRYVPTGEWSEHETILDLSDATMNVTVMGEVVAAAMPYVARPRRIERTGSLIVYAGTHAEAVATRRRIEEHPMQLLRIPDHAGMDRALAVTGTAVDADGPAWRLTAQYVDLDVAPRIPDTASTPQPTLAAVGATYARLGDLAAAGTLAAIRGAS